MGPVSALISPSKDRLPPSSRHPPWRSILLAFLLMDVLAGLLASQDPFLNGYPLVVTNIAMENGPSIVDLPMNIVISHSYVKLPEGAIWCHQTWLAGKSPN